MARRKTTEQFIKEATTKHGGKYNYNKVIYINNSTKITITCNHHGDFQQRPSDHLRNNGCPECSKIKRVLNSRKTTGQFIKEAKNVHGNKYDYSLVNYIGAHYNVIIICCICNHKFQQRPHEHLKGQNCPKCMGHYTYTTDEWIKKAKNSHGDKYDYSKTHFINSSTKVDIICKEHGLFSQCPTHHINKIGCPKCVHKTQAEIGKFIEQTLPNYIVITDKYWEEIGKFRPDFRIPDIKLIVEYDGEQHFRQVWNWLPSDIYMYKDTYKAILYINAGYSVIRISYDMYKNTDWKATLLPYIRQHETPIYKFISYSNEYDKYIESYNNYKNNPNELYNLTAKLINDK